MSMVVIALAAALVGGGTMAWFTAKVDAPQNEFTAGTVMIEADGTAITSQYFHPDEGVFVYGVIGNTGDLYEIDVQNKVENRIFENPKSYSGWYPNGLAFDSANDRLYFAASKSKLWYYDFSADALIDAGAFQHAGMTGSAHVYGAAFGGGYYWYVPNGSAYLYKVAFDGDGKILSSSYVVMTDANLQFGDMVIDYADGVIYGSDSSIYFTYEIATGTFTDHGDKGKNLQLAWGHDGVLYGHSTSNNGWYDVEPATGTKTLRFNGQNTYNDLASGSTSYWNPGDCSWARYTVHNTGSKDIRVRAYPGGVWEFDWEWLWQNWDALCFSETAARPDAMEGEAWDAFEAYVEGLEDPVTVALCDGSDWVEEDGFFYYTGEPLAHCEEAELCLRICLDGELATNEFQGGTYRLTVTFHAVQSSHHAPFHQWGTALYGTP